MCVRVDLGAALRGRRKSVHDDEDPHQTILDRNGFQPLIADSAPRYWPSGHANASAIARPTRGREPLPAAGTSERAPVPFSSRTQRRCTASDVAIARASAGSVGIARTSNSSNSRRCRRYVRVNSYRADRSCEWITVARGTYASRWPASNTSLAHSRSSAIGVALNGKRAHTDRLMHEHTLSKVQRRSRSIGSSAANSARLATADTWPVSALAIHRAR